jgi:hypothetical protein
MLTYQSTVGKDGGWLPKQARAKQKYQQIGKAVRSLVRLGTGSRSHTGQHGLWDHGFQSHSKHTFSSAFFPCIWCPFYAGLAVLSMEPYQTWAALASRIRGAGGGGEGASDRLIDGHACRWTDRQLETWTCCVTSLDIVLFPCHYKNGIHYWNKLWLHNWSIVKINSTGNI